MEGKTCTVCITFGGESNEDSVYLSEHVRSAGHCATVDIFDSPDGLMM